MIERAKVSKEKLLTKVKRNKKTVALIRSLQVFAIDEIGRLGAKTLESIDYIFQQLRGDSRFFGGVKVLLAGDFLQCPPIDATLLRKSKFFRSFLQSCAVVKTTIGHRFTTQTWFEELKHIRKGELTEFGKRLLESRVMTKQEFKDLCTRPNVPLALYPKRDEVDQFNRAANSRLSETCLIYKAIDSKCGRRMPTREQSSNIERSLPHTLELKVGSRD